MAIVCETRDGWVVDHQLFINNVYAHCCDFTTRRQPLGKPSNSDKADGGLSPCGRTVKSVGEDCQEHNVSKSQRSPTYADIRDSSGTGTEEQSPVGSGDRRLSYELKGDLFEVHDRFMMDSCFQRWKEQKRLEEEKGEQGCEAEQEKRKRKFQGDVLNEQQQAANEYHDQVKEHICSAVTELVRAAREKGYFRGANTPNVGTNNQRARALATQLETSGPSFSDLCDMSKDIPEQSEMTFNLDNTGETDPDLPSLVDVLIRHAGPRACVRRLMGEMYLIPPQVTFLMSDLSRMAPLVKGGGKYDLVVMDPPWGNKSVKRKKKYRELEVDTLLQIPVLAARGALVAVWTTNRASHRRFVLQTLFPRWGARHVATWHWAKVTQRGELITDLHSAHGKRPYETLLLGRVSHHPGEPGPSRVLTVPDRRVVVSVPCSLHSSKPPLQDGTARPIIGGAVHPTTDILRPYLPENGCFLELFARNLLPGWTSWGNEVLKFQQLSCFELKKPP